MLKSFIERLDQQDMTTKAARKIMIAVACLPLILAAEIISKREASAWVPLAPCGEEGQGRLTFKWLVEDNRKTTRQWRLYKASHWIDGSDEGTGIPYMYDPNPRATFEGQSYLENSIETENPSKKWFATKKAPMSTHSINAYKPLKIRLWIEHRVSKNDDKAGCAIPRPQIHIISYTLHPNKKKTKLGMIPKSTKSYSFYSEALESPEAQTKILMNLQYGGPYPCIYTEWDRIVLRDCRTSLGGFEERKKSSYIRIIRSQEITLSPEEMGADGQILLRAWFNYGTHNSRGYQDVHMYLHRLQLTTDGNKLINPGSTPPIRDTLNNTTFLEDWNRSECGNIPGLSESPVCLEKWRKFMEYEQRRHQEK